MPAPLLSAALARLAACGATLMLVLPVVLSGQQPRTLARAAALRAAAAHGPVDAADVATPTAARDLPRGHVLAAGDMSPATPAMVGWTTRRLITAGEPLREPAVVPPGAIAAVSPGQRVAIVWRDAQVEVRLAGIAAGAASVGSTVGVRVDARRRFEGVVIAPGVVRVP